MYLEFRHLKTIKAIHEYGGLARAADILVHIPICIIPSGQSTRRSSWDGVVPPKIKTLKAFKSWA